MNDLFDLRFTIYDLRFTIYNLRFTIGALIDRAKMRKKNKSLHLAG